jgi:hypothetical protein
MDGRRHLNWSAFQENKDEKKILRDIISKVLMQQY